MKKILGSFKQAVNITKDERKSQEALQKIFTSKKLFIYGLLFNVVGVGIYMYKFNENNYDMSLSRLVSRIAGRFGDITIPKFLRKPVYTAYMKIYNVNFEEITDKNLENYKCVKDFFIREINVKLHFIHLDETKAY